MGIFGFFKKNKNMLYDNGLNKEYYDDGKGNLEREYFKVNGKKELGEKVFFKSGKIMAEHTYKNGKLNGTSIVYYESGEKRMEANWEDGMNGKRLEFYLDGTLKSEKNYKNTLLNGPFKEYDEKGNLINEGVYIDDLLESEHKNSILSDLPESPIKSIDDLDLDPETKKKLEESTLFVKEDGTFDESRGSGKDITESLDFIKNIKGIDIEKIVFDLKTFQTMDNNVPPYTDMDGSWYVKFETIMKCFSEKNLEAILDELLKSNNISKDSGKVNLNVMSGTEPLTFYDGNGFTIDIPPVEGSRKLIVIKKQEIEELESNRTDDVNASSYCINDIFLNANELQNEGKHLEAIDAYLKVIELINKNEAENIMQGSNYFEVSQVKEGDVHIIPLEGVFFNLGSSYNTLKNYEKAKKSFEKALELNKEGKAIIDYNLGCAKINLGDFSSCIEDFDNTLNKDSEFFNAYYMRACAYASDQSDFTDLEKALSDVKKYLEYEPEDSSGNSLLLAIEASLKQL